MFAIGKADFCLSKILNKAEIEAVKEAAKEKGMKLEEYIRNIVMEQVQVQAEKLAQTEHLKDVQQAEKLAHNETGKDANIS